MGSTPEWIRLIRAAQTVPGVTPWELAKQGVLWVEMLLAANTAHKKKM